VVVRSGVGEGPKLDSKSTKNTCGGDLLVSWSCWGGGWCVDFFVTDDVDNSLREE